MHKKSISLTALLILLALFFAVNLVSGAMFRSARIDLTEAKLFTLSDGTRNILGAMEDQVTLRLFYSKKLATKEAPGLERYAQRVTELLEEYEAHSDGKLRLLRIDPIPFSEDEDQAGEFGMRGIPVNSAGERIYFGIAGTNTTDEEETIPFMELPREDFLEYDLTKLVYSLAFPNKHQVGLLSTLPIQGAQPSPFNPQAGSDPWFYVSQIQAAFEVEFIERDAKELPADIDILVLHHPKELDDQLLFQIDQFALGGGKVLAFLDPHCEADLEGINPQDQMSAFSANRTSDLGPLPEAWGFEVVAEKLAGDRENAHRVGLPQGGDSLAVLWLALDAENFDGDDPITSNLKKINLPSVGVLRQTEGAETELSRLVWTGEDSMEIERLQMAMRHDPVTLLDAFVASGEELTLAARVRGPVKTAYPDGPPEPPVPEGEEAPPPLIPPDGGWLTEGRLELVVVADADLLQDRWWVNIQNFFGNRIASPTSNNCDLLINALDNLTGNEDLISLRSRTGFERPFTLVEEMRAEADARFREEERALQDSLQEMERKINELQTQKEGAVGALILSPEQRDELERFRAEKVETRKKLRDVKHSLNKNIDKLGTWVKLLNVLALPLLISLLAISLGAYRMNRKRN